MISFVLDVVINAWSQAYLHPLVNSDKGRFVFGQPNFGRIKRFLAEKLFWTEVFVTVCLIGPRQ